MKINTISITSDDFPDSLRTIPDPPQQLFYIGNKELLHYSPAVAIVGTRKPTTYGREVTIKLAEGLARRGVTIVSGLALGMDGIAQHSAIAVGGRSIAVLASGLDTISPRSHRNLAIQILERHGILISTNPPGTPPLKWEFLKRNRLISGLSQAVVVTEAAAKSGTLNTVMHALAQGRDVYAVPGNITSPMSIGCNRLIEQGATPIVDSDSFIDHIVPQTTSTPQLMLVAETPHEQIIIDLLTAGIHDGDELQVRSRLEPSIYAEVMTMLEIRGVIYALGANKWSRR